MFVKISKRRFGETTTTTVSDLGRGTAQCVHPHTPDIGARARRRTDHLLLADTFQRCLGWCYECLESTSGGTPIFFRVPFRRGGDDEEAFAALARTVLFPKLLAVSDARAMDVIADALVRSFVADGDADKATKLDREGFVDGLRVLEVVGAPRERRGARRACSSRERR